MGVWPDLSFVLVVLLKICTVGGQVTLTAYSTSLAPTLELPALYWPIRLHARTVGPGLASPLQIALAVHVARPLVRLVSGWSVHIPGSGFVHIPAGVMGAVLGGRLLVVALTDLTVITLNRLGGLFVELLVGLPLSLA